MMASTEEKRIKLRQHKALATGLFLLMALIYILMIVLKRNNDAGWIGYVEAFSEAGMVGALADWFAVTALFHYPLGLKIPHTNLIERSKNRIGDSLGSFVVDNFLSDKNIRPYIEKLTISNTVATWLQKEKNIQLLTNEMAAIGKDIVINIDDDFIAGVVARKSKALLNEQDINGLLANVLHYFREKKEHERIIDTLLTKIKQYVSENEELVRDRVSKESHILIPDFVDNMIARKIVNGVYKYIDEIQNNKEHSIRAELENQIIIFENDLRNSEKWKEEINNIKKDLLAGSKLESFAKDIWLNIKNNIIGDIESDKSGIKRYLIKTIKEFSQNLNNDEELRNKIDKWIKYNAYNYILRNSAKASELISNTVGTWEGKELSEKLELEVGKDLQFIRINGTLVGGLVGLVIHTLTQLFS